METSICFLFLWLFWRLCVQVKYSTTELHYQCLNICQHQSCDSVLVHTRYMRMLSYVDACGSVRMQKREQDVFLYCLPS